MKFFTCAALASIVLAPAFAAPGAQHDKILISPGESETLFLTNSDSTYALPVFRICFNSNTGHNASVRITSPEKGPAAGNVEPLASGQCIYSSGRKLVLSVDADVSPEAAAKFAEAEERANAWVKERIAELRAIPEPTEEDKALLSELEGTSPSEAETTLARLQYEQTAKALAAKPERTKAEEAERVWSQYRAMTIGNEQNSFLVTLIPD